MITEETITYLHPAYTKKPYEEPTFTHIAQNMAMQEIREAATPKKTPQPKFKGGREGRKERRKAEHRARRQAAKNK